MKSRRAQVRSNDWFSTIWQSFPSLLELSGHLEPTFRVDSVAGLDAAFVRSRGVEGIIWDVDGTLAPPRAGAVASALQPAFETLLRCEKLRHVILSNCTEDRYLQLGRIFPSMPVLRLYEGPEGVLGRRLLGGTDSWLENGQRPVPGSALRQIRKPDSRLIEFALRELGCSREGALMIGDQYYTDIAGANMSGVRSLKVETLGRRSFSRPVRLLQGFEKTMYRLARMAHRD